jgi:polysaccharide export outer membrane protein
MNTRIPLLRQSRITAICLLGTVALLAVAGCSSTRQVEPEPELIVPIDHSPVLAPGYLMDIRVMVAGNDEVKEKGVRIQESGQITLPLLGSVKAAGMTLDAFQNWLTEAYNENYFIDPIVSAGISIEDNSSAFPWGYVTVLGRVESPGRIRIPPTRDLTIMQAIQEAGGFIKYAKESGIEITRQEEDGGTKRMTFDVRKMAKSSDEADIRLEHGDVIYVPEVIF